MKKVYLRFFLVFLAIAFTISCTKELISIPKDALTIEKAKAWYEKQQTEPVIILKSSKSNMTVNCTPDWTGALASNNANYEVVETPLTSLTKFGFSTQESMELSKKNNDPSLLNSYSRFLVEKNKKTGLRDGYIMTVIGDAEYLKTRKNQLSSNTYLKKDKDFSGYVLFHNTDGVFVNGWHYKNGIATGTMTLAAPNQSLIRLKSRVDQQTQCYAITIFYNYLDNPAIEIISEFVVCSGGGDGSAGNPGGGGGGTNPTPDPVQPPIILQYLNENPCLQKLYMDLMTKHTLPTLTSDYRGFIHGNLNWNIGNLSNYEAYGITDPINIHNTAIYLDREYCNTASGFALTQTMIHEALHAKFFADLNSVGGIPGIYDGSLNADNFITLFNYYQDHHSIDGSGAQHDAIADEYRNTIISGLKDYDALNVRTRPKYEYIALSWAGLIDTNAWNSFKTNFSETAIAYKDIIDRLKKGKEYGESTSCN